MKKNRALQIIVGYVFLFLMAILALQYVFFYDLFDPKNFLNWDAGHYHFIKENGYEGPRVAFFPLFPLIWKFLSLNRYGISILNAAIFLASFYLLIQNLKIRRKREMLLYLSIPSFIFFYLPYSESLFFLASVLMILGLKNNKTYWVYLGLFIAVLTRPAFTLFIPALCITEFLNKRPKVYLRIGLYLLVTTIGMVLVGWIQYTDTGGWFQFFNAQKNWGNELQIPKLPLTSWGTGFALRMDALAFFIGLVAGSFILALIFRIKPLKNRIVPRHVLFSLCYLVGITLLVLLYRGGSVFSLNRFVFATPFIIVVFHYWTQQKITFSLKRLSFIFGFLWLFWLLFGSYENVSNLAKFSLLTCYGLLLFSTKSDQKIIQKYSLLLFIFMNFSFQVISYIGFLNLKWIG